MLKIHKLVFHGNQHFEERHRPKEHSCKKEKEKLKCRTLIGKIYKGNSNTEERKYNIGQRRRMSN